MGQMGLTQASDDTTPEGNEANAINIIWIDAKVENEENTSYLKSLEGIANTKISCYKNIDDAVVFIKRLKFSETNIIISGRLYADFIQRLKDILGDIFIIPKIIVFTSNKEEFLKYNKDFDEKKNTFYNFGGIKTSFKEIQDFLMKPIKIEEKNEKNKNLENNLTFEYIDCKEKLVLPLLYKSLIENASKENMEEYTKYIYNKYGTNEEIDKLLNSIKYIKDIPIQLLSKYYTRLYTIESQFYYDINKELRENDKDKYLSYIKILYEGVKLKSLPLASNNILYRGSLISDEEIKKIKEYLSVKKPDLPGAIVFAKTFFSFSKDKKIAEKYIKKENKNEKLKKVLYILEKDDKIDYSLSTHSDIENISIYPYEKEVLFFPFSSFEIQDIQDINYNNEVIYEIKLLYLGKYIKEIENIDTDIPDCEFKKEIIKMGLIPKKKLKKTKEVIKQYKEFKKEIDNNNIGTNEKIIEKIEEKKDEKEEVKDNVENELKKPIDDDIDKDINEKIVNEEDKLMEKTKEKNDEKINENKQKENNTNNDAEYCNEINIVYKIGNQNNIRIFGGNFVMNNKSKCKIEFENKEYDLIEWFNIENYTKNKLDYLRIKLKNINNVTNMACMFRGCSSLSSLPDISKWNTNNVTDMGCMFSGCKKELVIPEKFAKFK